MNRQPSSEESIFLEAVEIRSEAERLNYLRQACGDDESLRAAVEALLSASNESGDLLDVTQAHVPAVDRSGSSDRPGSVIGPYKVLQEIGEGGMGVVYMAEQSQPVKRRVALKIIKPGMDSRHVIARFEAEQQALAMMEHPNVARVLDAGTTDAGRPYFAMELVKGIPITTYCDTNHLTNRRRLELFADVCHAVQHAHHKGIIHRDLKPSNVLVAEYDDQPVPKVIDFGVAKALNQSLTDKTMFTQYGQIVGTIEYMSPEQAKFNQLDVDTRSDIYSLGVLLYELLTGNTPFDKDRLRSTSFDELIRIIGEEEPPRPSTRLHSSETLAALAANRSTEATKLAGLVRGELDWIVMRAMEKDRTRRYETASALAADVQRYLRDEPVEACPPSASYRLHKFVRRHRTALSRTAAAVVIACLATIAVTFGWKYFSGREQLAIQRTESQQQQQAIGQQRQREQQAREEGIPRLRKLLNENKYTEAFALATELDGVVPGDPTVARLRREFSHQVSVQTFPDGADAYWRDYDNPQHEWQYAGRTPIDSLSMPLEMVLWKVSREGFDEVIGCRHASDELIRFTLDKTGEAPSGMVRVAGNACKPNLYRKSFDDIELDDYYIDRCEVTNRQFKEFVDAGGYEKREYWDTEFEQGLDVLTWNDVADRFFDESDVVHGPATWRDGTYPEGEADFPVRGVSWYEARAYARFAGKELPTVVHWLRARGDGGRDLMQIAGQSHIGSDDRGPVAVGSRNGVGPFGTHDMAGNVAEWCFNSADKPKSEGDQPQRLLLGASWNEVAYKFEQADTRPPLDRSPTNGFRCAKYSISQVPQEALARITRNVERDLLSETPINDEMYELCQGIYTRYLSDKPALKATVTQCKETAEYRHEKVEINGLYDRQRLTIHLLLPKKDDRRFQPVVFFPGIGHFKLRYPFPEQALPESQSGDVYQRLNEQTGLAAVWDELLFLVDSGRAVAFPIYEGSFDRRFSSEFKIHHFLDFVRAIDYLESRPEIDSKRIGYLGTSWGAINGNVYLAMEKRIGAAILYHGGLTRDETPQPQFDPINFAPRVTTPTLMINAKDDHIISLVGGATPMFHFLGTPAQDKAWIVHRGWHMFNYTKPSPVWRRDALAWLDKYLGPVGQQSDYERLSARANFAVASGNWPQAADYYTQLTVEEATKAESSTIRQRAGFEGFAWNRATAALLMAGHEAGYRQLCSRMVAQFADRDEPWIRERVLKACCVRPDGVDMSTIEVDETILALAQEEVPEVFRPWTNVTCALAKLRSGNADQALRLAGRAVEGGKPNKMLQAMSLVIKSLAHHDLGNTPQAQASLDDAVELIDENLPKRVDGTVNPHFTMRGQALRHDWLIAELLRREAEERLTLATNQSDDSTRDVATP